jgi:hypothetical protein
MCAKTLGKWLRENPQQTALFARPGRDYINSAHDLSRIYEAMKRPVCAPTTSVRARAVRSEARIPARFNELTKKPTEAMKDCPYRERSTDMSSRPLPAARVAAVAEILACDQSDVRRLLKRGEMEGHRQGVRSVRIFLHSVRAYQDRNRILPSRRAEAEAPRKERPAPASSAAHQAAIASLHQKGVI